MSRVQDSARFLCSHWRELFDQFTPDTYQPRLLNCERLIAELRQICIRSQNDERWRPYVKSVQDELRKVATEEDDLVIQIPEFQWLVRKAFETNTPSEILAACEILENRTPEYHDAVFCSVQSAVEGLLNGGKRDAYKQTRRLATLAVINHLEDDDFADALGDDPREPLQIANNLIHRIKTSTGTYTCYFLVSGDSGDIQTVLRRAGFNLISTKEAHSYFTNTHLDSNDHVVMKRVESASCRKAAVMARGELSTAVSLLTLFAGKPRIHICDTTAVVPPWKVTVAKIDVSRQAFRVLHPTSSPSGDARAALRNLKAQQSDDSRVLEAVESFGAASRLADPKSRFLGMWSSLECLAGVSAKMSVLDQVKRVVIPTMILGRAEKILRYLAIRMADTGVSPADSAQSDLFILSKENFIHPWDLAKAVSRPENHPHIVELFRLISNDPFLTWRTNLLWEDFHKPSQLSAVFRRSEQRISWQIERIYRARNLLVHAGIIADNFPSLLDQLTYYSSMSLRRMIHTVSNKQTTRNASICYNVFKMSHLFERLEKSPTKMRVSDFVPGIKESEPSPAMWESS